jgi:hypothetical protein
MVAMDLQTYFVQVQTKHEQVEVEVLDLELVVLEEAETQSILETQMLEQQTQALAVAAHLQVEHLEQVALDLSSFATKSHQHLNNGRRKKYGTLCKSNKWSGHRSDCG